MTITVKLFASLRTGRFEEQTLSIGEHTTVRDILARMTIPENEAANIFINDRLAGKDAVLADGDVLAVLPLIGGG